MRAFVCTDYDSTIRKLVWLNESSAGVYVGLYDEKDDPHTSYHADGRHHTKLTRGGNEIEVFRAQHQPIASIATYQQIISTGAFYADKTMHRLPQFVSGSKETAFVLIGRGIFRHVEALAMNTFIVKRDYEATFRSDQFFGRPMATAAREILEQRGARNLGAISLDELFETMKGGRICVRQ
jgi:hypothetical protein